MVEGRVCNTSLDDAIVMAGIRKEGLQMLCMAVLSHNSTLFWTAGMKQGVAIHNVQHFAPTSLELMRRALTSPPTFLRALITRVLQAEATVRDRPLCTWGAPGHVQTETSYSILVIRPHWWLANAVLLLTWCVLRRVCRDVRVDFSATGACDRLRAEAAGDGCWRPQPRCFWFGVAEGGGEYLHMGPIPGKGKAVLPALWVDRIIRGKRRPRRGRWARSRVLDNPLTRRSALLHLRMLGQCSHRYCRRKYGSVCTHPNAICTRVPAAACEKSHFDARTVPVKVVPSTVRKLVKATTIHNLYKRSVMPLQAGIVAMRERESFRIIFFFFCSPFRNAPVQHPFHLFHVLLGIFHQYLDVHRVVHAELVHAVREAFLPLLDETFEHLRVGQHVGARVDVQLGAGVVCVAHRFPKSARHIAVHEALQPRQRDEDGAYKRRHPCTAAHAEPRRERVDAGLQVHVRRCAVEYNGRQRAPHRGRA
eukprot:IDg14881t1